MIDFLLYLQKFSTPALDTLFLIISALTSEKVFFVILGYIYWCKNKDAAYGAGIVIMSSFAVNEALKYLFKIPRPYVYSTVRQIDTHTGYGYSFPSGHAQLSATFAGVMSIITRKKAVYAMLTVLVILTGLSRMYLGVHAPADIAAGIFTGILMSAAGYFVLKNMRRKVVFTAVVLIINAVLFAITRDADLYKMTGFTAGFAAGHFIEEKYIGYVPQGGRRGTAVFAAGILITFAANYIPKFFGADNFLRYAATGLVITLAVPLLFKKLYTNKNSKITG